ESLMPFSTPLKSMIIKNACLSMHEDHKKIITLFFNSTSYAIGDQMKTSLSLYNGYVTYSNAMYVEDIKADLFGTSWFNDEMRMRCVGPLACLCSYVQVIGDNHTVKGSIQGALRIAKDGSHAIDGHLVIEDAVVDNYHVSDVIKMIITKRDSLWKSRLDVTR